MPIDGPVSVQVPQGNEIIFFADRVGVAGVCGDSVVIYNVNLDEYTILNDKQNYKSINLPIYGHCVFQHYKRNGNSTEYISFDENHIALYNHDQHQMYRLKLNYINKKMTNGENAPKFPTLNCLCVSLSNTSTNCMLSSCILILNTRNTYNCTLFFLLCIYVSVWNI